MAGTTLSQSLPASPLATSSPLPLLIESLPAAPWMRSLPEYA